MHARVRVDAVGDVATSVSYPADAEQIVVARRRGIARGPEMTEVAQLTSVRFWRQLANDREHRARIERRNTTLPVGDARANRLEHLVGLFAPGRRLHPILVTEHQIRLDGPEDPVAAARRRTRPTQRRKGEGDSQRCTCPSTHAESERRYHESCQERVEPLCQRRMRDSYAAMERVSRRWRTLRPIRHRLRERSAGVRLLRAAIRTPQVRDRACFCER